MKRKIEYHQEALTWDRLVELEPKLGVILSQIPGSDDRKAARFCANRLWHLKLKPQVVALVGWLRPQRHPILSTQQAYDLAYHKLDSALPRCRNCSCL
jgi:hypothetical protein